LAHISAIYSDFLRALAKHSARHLIDAAQNAMKATNGSENSLPRGIAHRMMGVTFGYIGDFRAGKPHLERALAILEVQRDADLVTRFNENPLIGTRTRSAIDAWVRGEADASEAHAARAVAEAETLGHVSTLCYVHGWKANLDALRRDPERALIAAEAALAASERSGARVWVPAASIVRDWALHKRNGSEFGARLLEERLSALDEVGHDILFRPLLGGLAAEADIEAGRSDGALKLMRDALDLSAKTGFVWFDAEARRVAGDILARRGDVEAAVAELTASLDLARSQGARAFELRAALSLAKLWRDQGKRKEARDLLAPVYGWFTEGFDTLDLKEAKALLDELHP
jgi:tetratricopeptide (TPR) repeat protein